MLQVATLVSRSLCLCLLLVYLGQNGFHGRASNACREAQPCVGCCLMLCLQLASVLCCHLALTVTAVRADAYSLTVLHVQAWYQVP